MPTDPVPDRGFAVLLAAGEGARIGFPKALLDAGGGRSFLAGLAQTFAAAGLEVRVVVGAQAERVARAHPALRTVAHPDWALGQLSSARRGIAAALAEGATQVLLHPVDAPRLALASVRAVREALQLHPAAFATWQGRPGHPVGLTAEAARAVLADTAARTLAEALGRLDGAAVAVDDPACIGNVNTPDDYRAAFGVAPRSVEGP